MSAISNWNTTAANNTAAPPDGAPEGMYASKVNDTIREMMAQIRTWYNDASWIIYGDGNGTFTIAYASGTSFTVAGVNVTTIYVAGRRVKAVGTATGTIYGSISSSSFSTDTTVNVTWDSGSLSNEALTVYISAMEATRLSDPVDLIRWGGTAGGTADALTLTPVPAITAYRSGQLIKFISSSSPNTGAATLAVSGLAAKNIRKEAGATALAAGDIPASQLLAVVYDGTQFILLDTFDWTNLPSGTVITKAYGEYTTNAALTAAIPYDDTIPQIGEGTQVVSVTPVLKAASSTVRVTVMIGGTSNSDGYYVQGAVFVGATADAVAASFVCTRNDSPQTLVFSREFTPSLTGTVTFALRVGPDNAARSLSLNGYTANRRYGGLMRTTMLVEEVKA